MYNLKIFNYGRANDEYFRKLEKRKLDFKFNFKYFTWMIMMIVFSKGHTIRSNKMYILYGKMHEKNFANVDKELKLYHGTILDSISVIKSNVNIMGLWSMKKRLLILIRGIGFAIKNHIPLKELWYWIDFVFLSEFIKEVNVKHINICGHYDRYAVWISHLCKENNVEFNIYQHGALSEISLPSKILCDECFVFSEKEKEFFEKYVIANKECKYEVIGFKSNIIFERLEKENNKIYIGIASQPTYTNETIEIINYLYKLYGSKVEICVYPHPREVYDELYKLSEEGKCKIYCERKHENIDVLITFFSTIVYDYLSVNKDIHIICIPPEQLKMAFFYLKEVILANDKEKIKEVIGKIIESTTEVINENT